MTDNMSPPPELLALIEYMDYMPTPVRMHRTISTPVLSVSDLGWIPPAWEVGMEQFCGTSWRSYPFLNLSKPAAGSRLSPSVIRNTMPGTSRSDLFGAFQVQPQRYAP